MLKSKLILVYGTPDKIEYSNHYLKESDNSIIKECYIIVKFSVNFLSANNILEKTIFLLLRPDISHSWKIYVEVISVEKILKNLDVSKAFRVNQISAKFSNDSAPLIVINLLHVIIK